MHKTAEAYIEDGKIFIAFDISSIPAAYRAGVELGVLGPEFSITKPKLFAKDVVVALNDEDEKGSTPIHKLFDEAMNAAIEQGADGVEETDIDVDSDSEG
jgi:hypothetical protein